MKGFQSFPAAATKGGARHVAERRAENARSAVADAQIERSFAHLFAGVGQKADADAESGPVPFSPVLNAEKEVPFEQNFTGGGRQPELFDRAGNDRFAFELFRELDSFAVRLECGGTVERNRQRTLKTEKFDGGWFRKFGGTAEVRSALRFRLERERKFPRRSPGNLEIVPQLPGAVRRGPVFFQPEYHRPRGGLEGVPFFGEGGERDPPVVEFQGGVVEQLRLCGGECAAQQNVGCKEKSVSHYECFFLLDTFIASEIALGCAALVKPAMLLDPYKIISYSGV